MRVIAVVPGATGYIAPQELFCGRPGRYPCIMRSMCTDREEAGPDALSVYRKSDGSFVVFVPAGVKARHHPGASISADGFFSVTMMLPNGDLVNEEIPDGYWMPW